VPKKAEIPTFGLEVINGLMGSGKSFYATDRMLSVMRYQARPVFTNLPFRWPVLRAYLKKKGGESLANLAYQLNEDHWRDFLERQNQRSKFRERYKVTRDDGIPVFSPQDVEVLENVSRRNGEVFDRARVERQTKTFRAQVDLLWLEHAGPEITRGEGANWISPGALIVIDEVQHWHPMAGQASETPDLLAYLTMLRHHQHWVWVITQDMTRVNINLRKLAHYYWTVWNRAEDRIAWGIRAGHLGLRAFAYMKQTPEQFEAKSKAGAKPSEFFTIFPWLPHKRVVFRLYDSFTNAGGAGELKKGLDAAREEAGLSVAEGGTVKKKKKRRGVISWVLRQLRRLAIAVVLLLMGGLVGALSAGGMPGAEATADSQEETEQQEPIEWPVWRGMMGTALLFDGQRVEEEEGLKNGATLAYYDRTRRYAVLRARGDYWLWRYGEPRPVRVGPIYAVRDALGELVDESGVDTGGAEP
jgi:zonular occludens toxin Zot